MIEVPQDKWDLQNETSFRNVRGSGNARLPARDASLPASRHRIQSVAAAWHGRVGPAPHASAVLKGVECLVGVADEGQAHLGLLLFRHGSRLGSMNGAGILLRNLVDGEVGHINVGAESRFERGTDVAKLVPHHAPEERVVLDLGRTTVLAALTTDAMLRVAQEATNEKQSARRRRQDVKKGGAHLRIRCSESRDKVSSSGKYKHSLQLTILR